MSIKTRIDGRSKENDFFVVKDGEGNMLAKVKVVDKFGVNLNIDTAEGLHIEKPNGWASSCKE